MGTLNRPMVDLRSIDMSKKYRFPAEEFPSLEEFLSFCVDKGAIFYYKGDFSYAEDIQFDFKAGEVYIPFLHGDAYGDDSFTDKQKETLAQLYGGEFYFAEQYMEKLKLVTFDKLTKVYSKSNEVLHFLMPAPATGNETDRLKYVVYVVNLADIKAIADPALKGQKENIYVLYELFLLATFRTKESIMPKYVKTPKFINKVLEKEGLNYYKEYINLPEFPSREYSWNEVKFLFDVEDFPTYKCSMNKRRFPYLNMLFFSIVNDIEWVGFTKGDIKLLRNHKNHFAKFGTKDACLVLQSDLFINH